MGMTLALGCYTNDPIRVPVALHGLRPILSLPNDVNGYGLATCIDDHVVQKRVPMWPKNTELEQLMNNKRGGFSVLQMRRKSDVSPKNGVGANQMGPYKLRRFAAAIGGGPVNGDEAMAEREQLYAKLPDFLRRSVQGHQSGETLFLTLLSQLSDLGLLDAPAVAPEVIKEIINEVVADLPGSGNRYITFTTGANIIHYNQGFRGQFLQVMGLTDQWADEVDPNFTDTSAARERLRRFRALFVHTISGHPHPQKELPDLGPVKITSLVEDGFWEIQRDFVLRQL
jgi:hypothetical protein